MKNIELLKVLSESVSEDELVALTRKLVSMEDDHGTKN